ncbi:hypothetical protein [Corynebacterium durum]|uniref:hypothetical protein n=1 Tax=Corynebacterium durum TaxID=61592 RepID=UPI00389AC4CF
MQTFTTAKDIENYVHESLQTSAGYPDDYDIEAITDALHALAGWDDKKQAFIENWDEGTFWEIVAKNDISQRD